MKKKSVILVFVLAFGVQAYSQQPSGNGRNTDTTTFSYISNKWLNEELVRADTSQYARVRKLHDRWDQFWLPRASKDTLGSGVFEPAAAATFYTIAHPTLCPSGVYKGNWSFLGPAKDYYGTTSDNAGRVISLWVSPTNQDYILAGSGSGGLWKTTSGGKDWINITDQIDNPSMPGTIGINQIAVHPANQQYIYIGTGGPIRTVGGGAYSLGLMYSYDGGINWYIDYNYRYQVSTNNSSGFEKIDYTTKLAFSPYSNKLYAIAKRKILVMAGSGIWQNITPAAMSNLPANYTLSDFEFTESSSGKVIFTTTGNSKTQYIFTLNEANGQWSNASVLFPTYMNTSVTPNVEYSFNTMYDIALTQNDRIYWNVGYDNIPKKLFISDANGSNLSLRNNGLVAHALWLTASRNNQNILYIANGNGSTAPIQRSTNGGLTWTFMTNTHADGRCILLYKEGDVTTASDDIVFAGTDGGVAKKEAFNSDLLSITGKGLNISQMVGLSTNTTNSGMLVAGSWDNGVHAYHKERSVPWSRPVGGDGLLSTFSRNGTNLAYTQSNDIVSDILSFLPASPGQNPTINYAGSPGNPPDATLFAGRWHRPIQVDEQNRLKVGFHFIFRRDPTAWVPAFGGNEQNMKEPKPIISMSQTNANVELVNNYKKPREFIVSEADPTVAYIAYEDIVWDDASFDLINSNNLFRSTSIGNQSQSWNPISPRVKFLPISDIEIDPQHPNRIWVSYGSVYSWEFSQPDNQRKNRIFYSSNYGTTWTDVSKGLPMVPIMNVLYVEGSDDVLFAGTDMGVYRWNKELALWQCFNENMPRCMISGMEINYCTGKLRVSTYGRGIWETDLQPDMNAYTPGFTETISLNTTWGSSKTISGSVLVRAGATLTINSNGSSATPTTIYMPHKGKILIEPKGRVVVDGATITNDCDGAFWYGIEVAGNPNQPETPDYQGVLELNNGAVLQHARLAISNFDLPAWRCGGIVFARNSSIKNCIKATSFNYTNNIYYANGTSTCSFDNVNFIKDDPKYPIDQGGYFSAWNIAGGVKVTNCKFLYDLPLGTLPQKDRFSAMSLQATGIEIRNCTFEGFRRGIYVTDFIGLPQRQVNIANNTFTKQTESIIMGGNSYGRITGNLIKDMVGISAYGITCGIYLNSTQGADVNCNNRIEGSSDCYKFAYAENGLVAVNTTKAGFPWGVSVKRTIFDGLCRGIQTQGNNLNFQATCNSFKNNSRGFIINPQPVAGGPQLFGNQGTGCDGQYYQANNSFEGNIKDISSYSNVQPWTYYAGAGTGQMPATWSGPNVTVVPPCGNNHKTGCNESGWFSSCLFSTREFTFEDLSGIIETFRMLNPNNPGFETEQQSLLGDIVTGYNELRDVAGLRSFLETEEKSTENEYCRRLLIPMYIEQKEYPKAYDMMKRLRISEHERQAYMAYYDLIAAMRRDNRSPESLWDDEIEVLKKIAADDVGVAPFAKSLLEWGRGIVWEHPIDDLPEEKASGFNTDDSPFDGVDNGSGSGGYAAKSRLMDAVPNPANGYTVITLSITDADSYRKPMLLIKNAAGHHIFSQALTGGKNEVKVPVGNWSPGIYFYSLSVAGKVLATQKLSVIH